MTTTPEPADTKDYVPERDRYDRALYPDSIVPPADAGFAQWRGRTCAPDPGDPGRTHTPNERGHDHICVQGWIPSGDWWLHCGRCRPTDNARPEGIHEACAWCLSGVAADDGFVDGDFYCSEACAEAGRDDA